MIETGSVRLARGVRLRRDGDAFLMLVPEGIVTLNESAFAALELADGSRDVGAIVSLLAERFEDTSGALADDVRDLLEEFIARGYVVR